MAIKIAGTTVIDDSRNLTNITNINGTAVANLLSTTSGYATQSYVDGAITNLVDSSPAALDTLNELAAALGDDPNFATTVSTNIGGKVSKSGDTMTGDLKISKTDAAIYLNDSSGSPTQQGMRIRAEALDSNLPGNEGVGFVFEEDPASGSPDTTPAVIATGEFYAQSNQKVFHTGHHPNADKWTTSRTLSLTGDVTGSVSWDGSGNASLAATVANGGGGSALELYAENPSSPTTPTATGTNAVAIGTGADALATGAIAIGENSYASSSANRGLSLGRNSYSHGAEATAVGSYCSATATYANAFGHNATSAGQDSSAIGKSRASGTDSFAAAIANNTSSYGATGSYSIAMGDRSKSTGSRSIAISGFGASSSGTSSLAIGYQAAATQNYASGFGYASKAYGAYSFAGTESHASGSKSVALGIGDTGTSYGAQHTSGVALGYQAVTTADKQIALGSSTAQVKVSGAYMLPTADGTAAQVLTTNGSGVVTFADAGGALELYAENPSSPTALSATGTNSVAMGDGAYSTGSSSVSLGKSRASGNHAFAAGIVLNTSSYGASGANSVAIGTVAKATSTHSVAVGNNAQSTHSASTALGVGATTTSANQVALGGSGHTVRVSGAYNLPATDGTAAQVLTTNGSGVVTFADAGGGGSALELYAENPSSPTTPTATGTNAVAIGTGASSSGNNAVSLGRNCVSSASGTVAIGNNSASIGDASVSVGTSADAEGAGSTAIGFVAQAISYRSTAIGYNATTNSGASATALTNSYASGANSFAAAIANNSSSYGASGANSIAMGDQAKSTTHDAVAIGKLAQASGMSSTALGSRAEASGNNSVSMNTGSTASGNGAMAFGGYSVASANNSVALGVGASSNIIGKFSYSNGGIAFGGYFPLHLTTSNATPAALTTDGSSAGTTDQIVLPNNSAFAFHGTIVARQQASQGTASAAWKIEGLIRREGSAGTAVLVNSATTVLDNTPAWGMTLSADTTNGGLKIEVTGAAATNIRWVATINTSEVTY